MKKKKAEKFSIDELPEQSSETADESLGLSEEEISLLKESIGSARIDRRELPPHDQSGVAGISRFVKKNAVLSVAAFIIAIAIVISAVGGTAYLALTLFNNMKDYTVIIGDDEPYKVSVSDAVIGDVLYIDLRRIADHTGLTLSGSATKIQFTSIKNGSYLLFENDSEYVFINGGRTEIKAITTNGQRIVTAKAYVDENQCLVPLTFLEKAVSDSTLAFNFDEGSKTIYVRPKYFVYDNDVENKVMKDPQFITDNFNVTIPENQKPTYTYSYTIDVSPYISSIDTEYLMLVNKNNSAGKYKPENLKALTCPTTRELYLDYDAAVALDAMMLEMAAAGIEDTYVTSAYRSYDYQSSLYWGYVEDEKAEALTKEGVEISDEEAERRASEYSARPGESEHQTGLCIDFIT